MIGLSGRQIGGFERGGERDRLEYRTRLEGHGYGVVLAVQRALAGLRRKIRIVRGIAGQREDIAGLRIHRHHAAGFGVMRLDGRGKFALGDELQPLVDGQRDGRSGTRAALQLRIDAAPLHVGQHQMWPGTPRRSDSSAFSMPALPFSSKSTEPRTCAASGAARIVPLALAFDIDPIEL